MSQLHEQKIKVSDIDVKTTGDIELLIGADNVGHILTGNIFQLCNGLTATETRFGWTLMGQIATRESTMAMNVISMHITSTVVSELWKLETIGIYDPVEVKSRREKEMVAKRHFIETVTQNSDRRYSVSLPWMNGMKEIPNNKSVAEKRLVSTTNKLNSMGKYFEYEEILNAWEGEDIVSECQDTDSNLSNGCHYIPHRAVLKPQSKTTPMRPVFYASCKVGRSPSLNDCLEKGPNLLEILPSILLRFRMGKIGVISDIRKAFLMIEVHAEDRDFLRFLWWKSTDPKVLKVFRHNRVVFGMNCSPFSLGALIEYHLGKVSGDRRAVAEKLLKSLYVDNCVTSVNTVVEYENFKQISTELIAGAKMILREWERSGDGSEDFVALVLGLKWDKKQDSLFCESIKSEIPPKITKRVILSQIQKIFDPLGFLCPATLGPKLMLQKLWTEKGCWDDEVSVGMLLDFDKWWTEMSQVLDKLRVPRNCTGGENGSCQLHMFSDASKLAYAAIVFQRSRLELEFQCNSSKPNKESHP